MKYFTKSFLYYQQGNKSLNKSYGVCSGIYGFQCLLFNTLSVIDILLVMLKLFQKQSTLVISKSKGPSETLRDIHTSTYQICRIAENTNETTTFYKCNLTPLVRNIYRKYCGKGEKLLLRSNFSSYPQYFVTWC